MYGTTQKREIEEISQNEMLLKDLEVLPRNYSFEIPKTIWKIRSTCSQRVALQFPEGLTMFACIIADILEKYTEAEMIILGDVTYGACCVDHFTALALGSELLVHYGHSCLIPIQDTPGIHLLYVFVNIDINISHFVDTVRAHFPKNSRLAFVSTIQFAASLQASKRELQDYEIIIPQCSPLSPGELLGCTSPKIADDVSAIIYLGDGRFHLESIMIQNPRVLSFQYNPYSREFTQEEYGFELMIKNRQVGIDAAKNAVLVGLILGTLGRQGNIKIFQYLEQQLKDANKRPVKILLSEIFADKLDMIPGIQCWVQVACPRLSIDWGHTFSRPLLTPYELSAALGVTKFSHDSYPMDYYAYEGAGAWTNNWESYRPQRRSRKHLSLVGNNTLVMKTNKNC